MTINHMGEFVTVERNYEEKPIEITLAICCPVAFLESGLGERSP